MLRLFRKSAWPQARRGLTAGAASAIAISCISAFSLPDAAAPSISAFERAQLSGERIAAPISRDLPPRLKPLAAPSPDHLASLLPPPPADPFAQLGKLGLDGTALRRTAEALGVDLAPVSTLDLSRIDITAIGSDDRRCLSEAVYYEARNQSLPGQMAVADVVLNRVASDRYPDSICGVVYQGSEKRTGCQFSFTCDGSMHKPVDRRAMFRAQVVATSVLGGFHVPLSQDATNYHATYVRPYWARTLDETAKIGDHVFYKRGSTWRKHVSRSARLASNG